MIKGLHHVALSTGNMERMLHFYRDLMGAKTVFELNWPVGTSSMDALERLKDSSGKVVMLSLGQTYVELFEFLSPTPKPVDPQRPVCDHGITHMCFEVTDLDAEYERCLAAGVDFHCPPLRAAEGINAAYLRDPDGNVVEFIEMLAGDGLAGIEHDYQL